MESNTGNIHTNTVNSRKSITNHQPNVVRVSEASVPSTRYIQSSPIITPQSTRQYETTRHEVTSQVDSYAPKQESRNQSYRNPSNIIQETSEEYRGSNKESFMNL